ncbi:MAG: cell division protein FtsW [Chitinivibrionales bacterium]|nr:cell division protein FtsW [Chitinivibrionales bacterium]
MVQKFSKIDSVILIIALLLFCCGVVFVYSSSFAIAQMHQGRATFFLSQHATRGLIALVFLYIFMHIDYHFLGRISNVLYCIVLVLLITVLLLPDSAAINGAKRWLSLGPIRFQVSDLGRITLILLLARNAEKMGDRITESKVLVQMLIKVALICILIALEPNFSTAAIIAILGLSMMYVAGARIKHIFAIFLMVFPFAVSAALSHKYILLRVAEFTSRIFGSSHGVSTSKQVAYQSQQALIGLGNGGLCGVGIGQGQQKYFYLPEPHTDFVFSILGEEMGFIGLAVVLTLFAILLYRGFQVSLTATDRMGQTMAFGITFVIGLYLLLHTFVNTGIVPTTGVPLPFLSYGGMSLIFTMSSIGILLNISSQTAVKVVPAGRQARGKKKV